ncbi:MAG: hypothetical protein Q7R89_02205 [bacterium]|nr:hypothetical protein [bacterium]
MFWFLSVGYGPLQTRLNIIKGNPLLKKVLSRGTFTEEAPNVEGKCIQATVDTSAIDEGLKDDGRDREDAQSILISEVAIMEVLPSTNARFGIVVRGDTLGMVGIGLSVEFIIPIQHRYIHIRCLFQE